MGAADGAVSRRALVLWVTAAVSAALFTLGVVLYFELVAEGAAVQCAGDAARWFAFDRPVLLWFVGVPVPLGVMLLGPGGLFGPESVRQRVLMGAFVVAVFSALSIGVPSVTVAGVCVRGGGVSVARLGSTPEMSRAELLAMRSSRTTDDRVVVLVGRGREVAVPLVRRLGLGRAGDPDGLAVALVAFSERAGLTVDDSRQREMAQQREAIDLLDRLATPP